MDNIKFKMKQALEQCNNNISSICDTLSNVYGAEDAIKQLEQAKFNIIAGMHEIVWIGKDRFSVKEKVVDEVTDDNPSAYAEDEEDTIGTNVDYKA